MLPYFQHAYFGNGYAGILTFAYNPNVWPIADVREYVQGTLSATLETGKCYYCEFWVEFFNYKNEVPYSANDAIGIFFSDTLPKRTDTDTMAMFYPSQINIATGRIISDTSNWEKISGTFVATGGEKYFTVGNFRKVNEINSIYFGTSQFDRSYYFFDNFSLCPCEDTIKKIEVEYLEVNPNPNNGNMIVNYNIIGNEKGVFEIYDMVGRKVFSHELSGNENTFFISGALLSSGVYFYQALAGKKRIGKDKIIVIK